MVNLEDMNMEQLENFLAKARDDGNKFAAELFPEKNPGFRRALNMMVKFAEARLDMLDQIAKGRKERAEKLQKSLDGIYRTIPEYAQWL